MFGWNFRKTRVLSITGIDSTVETECLGEIFKFHPIPVIARVLSITGIDSTVETECLSELFKKVGYYSSKVGKKKC